MSLPTILLYVRLVLLIDETGVPRENNRDMSKVTKKKLTNFITRLYRPYIFSGDRH